MSRPIITLTTDFGQGSPYVAQMKGVILTLNPEVTIVDITHAIRAQNIREGATILCDVTRHFPNKTIHIAVVDPGVGTQRKIVCAEIDNQYFIAPDNGLLSLVVSRNAPTRLIAVTNEIHWQPTVSRTFHGRDIMAPVAARLAAGLDLDAIGSPLEQLQLLNWPAVTKQPRGLVGTVIAIDSFGNLITDITADMLPAGNQLATAEVHCCSTTIQGVVKTYGDREPGSVIALCGSSSRLEIAVVNGNAADELDVCIEDSLNVRW
jgi:S-adenosylmethionine hydrolase